MYSVKFELLYKCITINTFFLSWIYLSPNYGVIQFVFLNNVRTFNTDFFTCGKIAFANRRDRGSSKIISLWISHSDKSLKHVRSEILEKHWAHHFRVWQRTNFVASPFFLKHVVNHPMIFLCHHLVFNGQTGLWTLEICKRINNSSGS